MSDPRDVSAVAADEHMKKLVGEAVKKEIAAAFAEFQIEVNEFGRLVITLPGKNTRSVQIKEKQNV